MSADAEFECNLCNAEIPQGDPLAYCEICDFCTCRICTAALDRRVEEIDEELLAEYFGSSCSDGELEDQSETDGKSEDRTETDGKCVSLQEEEYHVLVLHLALYPDRTLRTGRRMSKRRKN